jgi:hypothetical protein
VIDNSVDGFLLVVGPRSSRDKTENVQAAHHNDERY